MAEEFKFREVINPKVVQKIGQDIHHTWTEFDYQTFEKNVIPQLVDELSLMDRNNLVRDNLYTLLPKDYSQAIKILLQSFGPELGSEEYDTLEGFDVFYYMPHSAYVAEYGLAEEHFDISMNAILEITKRFTAEFSIRFFLLKYPEKTLNQLQKWVNHENVHVRRLVSEGSRPRLPLGNRLPIFQKDPTPILALLDQLKEDTALYVRRSVANNLNDIGKDNPKHVTDILERWSDIKTQEMRWLIQHALRSLIKEGNREALALLGYPTNVNIEVNNFTVTPIVKMKETAEFSFNITAHEDCKLMIDYAIHFMKANGKQKPKVFKCAKKELKKGETVFLNKKQSFKPLSTRKYYTGTHSIEIFINGNSYGMKIFEVS